MVGSTPAQGSSPSGTAPVEAILWTDGAARGNPGPAGCGAVLKRPDGELLASESRYLGTTTNNVAEYKGLLLGLELALDRGVESIEVRADSELLIRQLNGEYRVKSPGLKPLYEEAKRLLARFRAVRLTHVRRELNIEADKLANRGIDAVQRAESAATPDEAARAVSTSKSDDK